MSSVMRYWIYSWVCVRAVFALPLAQAPWARGAPMLFLSGQVRKLDDLVVVAHCPSAIPGCFWCAAPSSHASWLPRRHPLVTGFCTWRMRFGSPVPTTQLASFGARRPLSRFGSFLRAVTIFWLGIAGRSLGWEITGCALGCSADLGIVDCLGAFNIVGPMGGDQRTDELASAEFFAGLCCGCGPRERLFCCGPWFA